MTMNVLICLDTDGTIDTGKPAGPVLTRWLELLQSNGAIVVLVSPSPNCPKGRNNLPLFTQIASKSRRENLEDSVRWVQLYGMDPILKLYVSNNNDRIEAEQAGFMFVDEKSFAGARF